MKIKISLVGFILASLLATNHAFAQYCTASHGSGGCLTPAITQVTLNTLSAANTCSSSDSYNYYSPTGSNTTTLQQNQSYTLSVTVNNSAIGSAWIDFNNNQTLESSEWWQLGTAFTGTASVTITVPSNAVSSVTRLRIRTRSSGNQNGSTDACTGFGSGETEDYDITIGTPAPPPVLGPLPTITSVSPITGAVGSLDTINGTNFSTTLANNVVTYGTVKAQVISATTTRLVVVVPTGLTNKPISVTVNGLAAYSTKAFQPTFSTPGTINSTSFLTTPGYLYTSNTFTQASPIDFDNDGKMDLVGMSYGYLFIFRNIGTTGNLNGSTSFDAPITIYNGNLGSTFSFADIDGDGKQDIISANYNSGYITVVRNDVPSGSTTFNSSMFSNAYSISSFGAYNVIASDFDSDGKPELAAVSYYSSTVSIYKNNSYPGFVSFGTTYTLTTGSSPIALASTDIDNDNKPDLIVANTGVNTLSAYKNQSTNGNVAFGSAVSFSTNTSPNAIHVADMDGDGKNDLVVSYANTYGISIFRNNGSTNSLNTSSLNTKVDFTGSSSSTPFGVCIAELNGDGKPDILVVNGASSNGQSFWQNNATPGVINTSSLNARVDYNLPYTYAEYPAICDLDNDNRNDIIIAGAGTYGIALLKNQIGVFRANAVSPTYLTAGSSSSISFTSTVNINPGNIFSAQLSDSSGSFASPIIVGSSIGTTSGSINVTIPTGTIAGNNYRIRIISTSPSLTSDATPSFRVLVPPTITNIAPINATPGSTVQITGTNFSTTLSENFVYFGTVRATVTAATASQLTVTVPVSSIDANITVTILGNTATSPKIFTPTFVGSGVISATTLGSYVSFAGGVNPISLDLSDLNLDGKPDVTLAQNGTTSPTTNRLYRNQSTIGLINTSSFTTAFSYTAAGLAWNTQMADIDGDGMKDLLSVSNNTNYLSVQRNTSSSTIITMSTRNDFTLPSNGTGLAYGDIDLDGKTDVVTANFSTNNVSLLRNISTIGTIDNNSFASRIDMSVTNGGSMIGLEDMDLDGKLDLVVISNTGSSVTIYKNTSTSGSFSFATGTSFSLNSTPRGFTFGDLNNDGKPELLVTCLNNVVSIFENTSTTGNIALATRFDLTTGTGPWGVATGDIDGNGKTDIAIANLTANTISLIANNYTSGSLSVSNFATKVDYTLVTNGQPSAISICDIDGNQKPEVIVTQYNSSTFVVFPNNTPTITVNYSGSQLCSNSSVTIPFTTTLTFNPGNIFSAQLSDATGSFASPTTLGSIISTTAGSITGSIPSNTPLGSGYKIRIVSTSPSYTTAPTSNNISISNCPTISGINPTSGPIGTSVTISGANFSTTPANNVVYFGAVKASVISATSSSIVTSNPLGNNYKDITVTNLENNLTANKNLVFNTTFMGSSATFTANNFSNSVVNINSPGSSPQGVASADFDGDGFTDFVGAASSGSNISVFRNTNAVASTINSANFIISGTYTLTTPSYYVKTGDIDGDGKQDIVVFSYNSSTAAISIFKNTSTTGAISFATKVDLNGLYPAYTGDLVDMDNDGKMDIVTTSGTSSFSIFKNAIQSGTITSASFTRTDFTSGISVNSINHADFDGDGLNDLIFTGAGSVAYIFRNATGVIATGMFNTPISLTTGSSSYFISTADLNYDNKPDLAIANYGSSSVSIYRNAYTSGTLTPASFVLQTTLTTGSGSYSVIPIDIDGDNKIDLANGSQSTGMYLFKNTTSTSGGTITFNSNYFLGGGAFVCTDAADFNNDGKLDVIGANFTSNVYSIYQNTTPTFSVSSVGTAPYCSGSSISIPYNAPSGVFTLGNIFTAQLSDSSGSFASPTAIGSSFSTASGNITATLPSNIPSGSNYRIRVIASSPSTTSENSVQIIIRACPVITAISSNTANVGASITITGGNFSTTASANIVYFGSVKATVTAATATQLTVTVPSGAIQAPITLTIGSYSTVSQQAFYPTFAGSGALSTTSFAARADVLNSLSGTRGTTYADFDNDGKSDLVTLVSNNNTVNVYRNVSTVGAISTASFASAIVLTASSQPWLSIAVDLTNDGLLDIATVNLGSNTISVFKNTTTGVGSISFAAKIDINLNSGSTPYGLASGDIDGDGLIDLAVANLGLSSVSVFKNLTTNGTLNFGSAVNFTTPTQPSFIVIAELDGDGKPDIATSNFGNNNISIFRNTATTGTINTSTFATRIDIATGSGPFAITTADIDNDGKLDLLVPNFSTNNLFAYRNTSTVGTIAFTSSSYTTASASGLNFITTGDLDGDGKQDIVTSNNTSNNITVYKNTSTSGNISLGSGFNLTTLSGNAAAQIGDFDGDNRPEIFVSSSNSNTISVFRNITLAPEPTTNASAFTVTNPTNTTLTLNWTNGNGSRRVVLAKSLTAVSSTPVDENTYTANSSFGLGTQIGSGNYVVYDGAGTTVTVTGLNLLTQYHFRIFEYNGTGGAINYLTTGTTVSNGTTLPVTLVSFNAKEQNGKALLTWVTSTEINNSHFDVERSVDGLNFKKVGEVVGSGNSNTVKTYRFVDELTNAKVTYYRLKQVDYNGDFMYSNIVNLNSKGLNAATQISMYPNPANSHLTIDGLTEQAMIYDAVGRVVLTITENGLVDISQLTPGVYFVKTSTETVKFVKQ